MTIELLVGDVRDRIADIADASVQTIVTSPPYYGLRDYGSDGQIGLEPTLGEYIDTLVAVMRDTARVLRADGTLWLNIGDSYASNPSQGFRAGSGRADGIVDKRGQRNRNGTSSPGFKQKDLMMVPARLALALQDDGWYLRSDIIWHKPNPMPESVTDRPTSAHEHIFLLTKRPRYYYDADAIRTEPTAPTTKAPDGWDTGSGSHGTIHRNGREKGQRVDKQRGHGRRHAGFNDRWDAMPKEEQSAGGANARNVWTIATQPFRGAHFATFPPELPRRCILAGSRPGDTVFDPFAGSGTTLLVADQLGRHAIGIEMNPAYADLARRRITDNAPLFADVAVSERGTDGTETVRTSAAQTQLRFDQPEHTT